MPYIYQPPNANYCFFHEDGYPVCVGDGSKKSQKAYRKSKPQGVPILLKIKDKPNKAEEAKKKKAAADRKKEYDRLYRASKREYKKTPPKRPTYKTSSWRGTRTEYHDKGTDTHDNYMKSMEKHQNRAKEKKEAKKRLDALKATNDKLKAVREKKDDKEKQLAIVKAKEDSDTKTKSIKVLKMDIKNLEKKEEKAYGLDLIKKQKEKEKESAIIIQKAVRKKSGKKYISPAERKKIEKLEKEKKEKEEKQKKEKEEREREREIEKQQKEYDKLLERTKFRSFGRISDADIEKEEAEIQKQIRKMEDGVKERINELKKYTESNEIRKKEKKQLKELKEIPKSSKYYKDFSNELTILNERIDRDFPRNLKELDKKLKRKEKKPVAERDEYDKKSIKREEKRIKNAKEELEKLKQDRDDITEILSSIDNPNPTKNPKILKILNDYKKKTKEDLRRSIESHEERIDKLRTRIEKEKDSLDAYITEQYDSNKYGIGNIKFERASQKEYIKDFNDAIDRGGFSKLKNIKKLEEPKYKPIKEEVWKVKLRIEKGNLVELKRLKDYYAEQYGFGSAYYSKSDEKEVINNIEESKKLIAELEKNKK